MNLQHRIQVSKIEQVAHELHAVGGGKLRQAQLLLHLLHSSVLTAGRQGWGLVRLLTLDPHEAGNVENEDGSGAGSRRLVTDWRPGVQCAIPSSEGPRGSAPDAESLIQTITDRIMKGLGQ